MSDLSVSQMNKIFTNLSCC